MHDDGTPDAVKVACPVWSEGKAGEPHNINGSKVYISLFFVTETDFKGDGKASHHYRFRDDDGELLGDPMHIVLVNGAYKDTAALKGKVIHDIMTTDPQEMLVPEIQQPFTYLKNTEKGQREMTYALEQLIDKGREEGRAEGRAEGREEGRAEGAWEEKKTFVWYLMAAGFSFDKIVDLTGSSAEVIQKIIDQMPGHPRRF